MSDPDFRITAVWQVPFESEIEEFPETLEEVEATLKEITRTVRAMFVGAFQDVKVTIHIRRAGDEVEARPRSGSKRSIAFRSAIEAT